VTSTTKAFRSVPRCQTCMCIRGINSDAVNLG